jgi:2-dehydro-3-deoxyphosphogluconate aldolase/(4S)-4-hydroxy-2-oxoglutarate aldolase
MNPPTRPLMSSDVAHKISTAGIIAVLVVDDIQNVRPLAEALLNGGVDVVELTLRTPAAWKAAQIMKADFPQITLGLGTLLTPGQVRTAVDMQVDFAVAPGCNPSVIKAAKEHGLSFAPGVATPSDIELAVEHGCRVFKYFPAEASGGMNYLSAMAGPYSHLGLKFIPLGGLNESNIGNYLRSPLVVAIGGSWIATRSLIQTQNWQQVTLNAQSIRAGIDGLRETNK